MTVIIIPDEGGSLKSLIAEVADLTSVDVRQVETNGAGVTVPDHVALALLRRRHPEPDPEPATEETPVPDPSPEPEPVRKTTPAKKTTAKKTTAAAAQRSARTSSRS